MSSQIECQQLADILGTSPCYMEKSEDTHETVFETLRKWREQNGDDATGKWLHDALHKTEKTLASKYEGILLGKGTASGASSATVACTRLVKR